LVIVCSLFDDLCSDLVDFLPSCYAVVQSLTRTTSKDAEFKTNEVNEYKSVIKGSSFSTRRLHETKNNDVVE